MTSLSLPVWGNRELYPRTGFPEEWGDPDPPVLVNEAGVIRARAAWIRGHESRSTAQPQQQRNRPGRTLPNEGRRELESHRAGEIDADHDLDLDGNLITRMRRLYAQRWVPAFGRRDT